MKLAVDNGENQQDQDSDDCDCDQPIRSHPKKTVSISSLKQL